MCVIYLCVCVCVCVCLKHKGIWKGFTAVLVSLDDSVKFTRFFNWKFMKWDAGHHYVKQKWTLLQCSIYVSMLLNVMKRMRGLQKNVFLIVCITQLCIKPLNLKVNLVWNKRCDPDRNDKTPGFTAADVCTAPDLLDGVMNTFHRACVNRDQGASAKILHPTHIL